MNRLVSSCAAAFIAFTSASSAGETRLATEMFAAGDVSGRTALMRQIEQIRPDDGEAAYALGAMRFFLALERFAQDIHRHGFVTPRTVALPLMRMPVPYNSGDIEPISYDKWRAILGRLAGDLAEAAGILASVPPNAEIGLEVDLANLRLDLNRDGSLDVDESIAALIRSIGAPPGPDRGEEPPAMVFRFDRADGYWLEGYAHFLMASARFWLAHDFQQTFETSFQLFFPRGRFPIDTFAGALPEKLISLIDREKRVATPADRRAVQSEIDQLSQREKELMRQSASRRSVFTDPSLYDLISLIHTINWDVIEPGDRSAVRHHLKQMIRLSRENWRAIEAEPDNDREWLPGPHQPGRHPLTGIEVTREAAQGWQEALVLFEKVLDGEALVPHPRFPGVGVNLKRFFEQPQRFDLVLSLTGPALLPYLETGEVLSGQDWRQLTRQFGRGNFSTYAVWFN